MSDFEKLINASDLIDWIIETDPEWCIGTVRSIVDHIEDMPPAQPEPHYCRECKWSRCHINVDKYGRSETY